MINESQDSLKEFEEKKTPNKHQNIKIINNLTKTDNDPKKTMRLECRM